MRIQAKSLTFPMNYGECFNDKISDIKSFMPMTINLTLLALWFSHKKQFNSIEVDLTEKREALMANIQSLGPMLKNLLSDAN